MMKRTLLAIVFVALFSPSVFAETMDGYTCFREHLDNVVFKNSVAIECTITNSEIISSSVSDSAIESSTVDSSSVANSDVRSSTISSSSITQSSVEKSLVQGGSALFFVHMYDTTTTGGIMRDSYGERTELHNIDVQRSEVRNSKLYNGYFKDSTIQEAYVDSVTAEDATLKGVVLNRATLIETFVENGWLDLFKADRSTFMNANIGNAELHNVALCKTWNRDESKYYGECASVHSDTADEERIPFVGMRLAYETREQETIRHNFTHMVDANTIAVWSEKPTMENGAVMGGEGYLQEINVNNRRVEMTGRGISQSGEPGEVPQGHYTDLWIPMTTKVGEYVQIHNTLALVGQENDDVWFVGNQTNTTTDGARVYDKKTGILLSINSQHAPLLKDTNADVGAEY